MKSIDIEDFVGLEVKIKYKEILKEYAEKAKGELFAVSPKSGRPNRATPYSTGWMVTEKPYGRDGTKETVWNRTNWQLTHLLENGHWISNSAHPRISWSPAQKHIKPTYKKIKPQFISAMKEVEIDANFK